MKKNRIRYISLFLLTLSPVIITGKSEGPSVPPREALVRLREGNIRFINNKRNYPHMDSGRREHTSKHGQNPFASVLSCSDSRVPVEHVFDAGIGDLFVIRVAGNVSDNDEIASIEYGVEHLGTALLVVLGHSSCGAVTAVTRGDKVHGSLKQLLDNITPAVIKAKKKLGEKFSEDLVAESIKLNVWQSIESLYRGSPSIVKFVRDKKLKVIGGLYHIHTGAVEWMGEHPSQAELLRELDFIFKKTQEPRQSWISGIF